MKYIVKSVRGALAVAGVWMLAFVAPAGIAWAQQDFPTRPVRLVVPFVPGGGSDFVARVVGQKLAESFGHQVLVDHRPGGGSVIASETVARSAPDGHTLYLAGTTFVTAPSLQKKLPFDPYRDFAPVTRVSVTPGLLLAHPSVPAKTVRDLVALAKTRPGALSFGSAGIGSASHLAGELLKMLAGVDMLHVPYKGSSQVSTALISGEVSLALVNPVSTLPHVKAGKLRVLAVTTAERSPLLPAVPTIAESGVRGYENSIWTGLLAPAATPKAIITRLHAEFVKALRAPEVVERLAVDGAQPHPDSPERFAAYLRAEIEKMAKVIKRAGIRVN
ncbi:MAG: tripartite tricarboxylate transporter substrate binding protein [Betaproteobacteria bacterium]|nr:tripartite tricarboxylate transporter substrate binding protein [Betaproteobacteria bacterium]MBI3935491.1 tripartite tricarboxylate transporter substrate binding protein [Betaproteobacteria bacterium]